MRIRIKFQTVKRLLLVGGAVTGTTLLAATIYPELAVRAKQDSNAVSSEDQRKAMNNPLPTREEILNSLENDLFDILVIGGGATGTGVALDAVTRGLKTGLVEKFDFSSGTSSRSTKLIHGGVRYLQKAVFKLDIEQFRMVKEALAERANLLDIAPHLAYPFPIMLPVYKWWQLPYFWAGIKMYDLVAGRQVLKPSYLLTKSKALELFPMLKKDSLVGALVYYDGQHDDARMNISLAITAIRYGASVSNYTEVLSLLKGKDESGKEHIRGARVRDVLTGREFDVKAKCVINAAGPYTDSIRTMADENIRKICQPSCGVHIVLPDYYSPESMGLLDPSTSDGRVIFFLPWQKTTLAGTTDSPCAEVTDYPQPTEDEIQFILKEIRNYLSPDVEVRRGDVMSAWSGIRPLVSDPNKKDTQSIARNHIIEVASNKLITIAGGKWTTYRHMAEETVDRAVRECCLKAKSGCVTKGLLLDGAHGWSPTLFIRLVQDFGLENQVAQHLANTYGDRAIKVAKLSNMTGKRWPVVGKRLHEEYPYIESEVKYAIREYACRAIDVVARRTRLAFCNVHAAQEALPRIVEIMAVELGWSEERKKEEFERAEIFLRREMGLDIKATKPPKAQLNFTKDEINQYVKRFKSLDYENKGFITINDLRNYFKKIGERVSEDELHDILSEVDLTRNAQVDLGEFLQLLRVLKQHAEDPQRPCNTLKRISAILTGPFSPEDPPPISPQKPHPVKTPPTFNQPPPILAPKITPPPVLTPKEEALDIPPLIEKPPDILLPPEKPPAIVPPVEKPPAIPPPVENPPAIPPPVEKPPAIPPPVEKSPAIPPPLEKPPDILPPVEKPPDNPSPEEKPPEISPPLETHPNVSSTPEKTPIISSKPQETPVVSPSSEDPPVAPLSEETPDLSPPPETLPEQDPLEKSPIISVTQEKPPEGCQVCLVIKLVDVSKDCNCDCKT